MNKCFQRILLSAILILGLASQLFFAWSDIEILVRDITLDDSYYYFQIAYNMASGQGSSFDGINETNGYQPLWQFLLVPLWWISSDKEQFVHLALTLAALFHVFVGYFLYRIVISVSHWMVALAAAALWLLSPRLMMLGISGMENSIYAFTLSATLLYYLKFKPFSQRSSPSLYFFGFLVGITFLARVDAFFLFITAFLCLALQKTEEPLNKRILKLTPFAIASFVTVLPYLCWNWLGFGLLTPISGQVKFWLGRGTVGGLGGYFSSGAAKVALKSLLWDDPINDVFTYLCDLIRPFNNNLSLDTLYKIWVFIFLAAVLLALLKFIEKLFGANKKTEHPPAKIFGHAGFFILFVTIHYFLYSTKFVIAVGRGYYFVPEYLLLAMLAPYALFSLIETIFTPILKKTLWPAGVLLAAFLYSLLYQLSGFYTYSYRGENSSTSYTYLNSYYVAQWLRNNTDPQDIIGAWNAGVVGYFSERKVINLDGIVNNRMFFKVMQSFNIADYVKSQGIKYLTDYLEINPSAGTEAVTQAFAGPRYLNKDSLRLVFITEPDFGYYWYIFNTQPNNNQQKTKNKDIRVSNKVNSLKGFKDILSWLKKPDNSLVISDDDGIQDWRCYISKTTDRIEKILSLPNNIGNYNKVSLNILMKGASFMGTKAVHTYNCTVKVGDRVVKTYQGGIPEILAWHKIPIDRRLIEGKEKIVVSLSLSGKPDPNSNYINIYGDVNNYAGKSFFNGNKEDLSPDAGPQKGEYMIRLVLGRN